MQHERFMAVSGPIVANKYCATMDARASRNGVGRSSCRQSSRKLAAPAPTCDGAPLLRRDLWTGVLDLRIPEAGPINEIRAASADQREDGDDGNDPRER